MAPEINNPSSIQFSLAGIAALMAQLELSVPDYQRSYSWHVADEDIQVAEYWNDISTSVANEDREYFLGTVVLSRQVASNRHVVIDGQQRLATTALLIAAVRDRLRTAGHRKAKVLDAFLAKETLTSDGEERRLVLNVDDDAYMAAIVTDGVVLTPDPKVPSQKLIKTAYEFLSTEVNALADVAGEGQLIALVSYLQDRARIGVIEVPTESDAYIIFETLNDRGADLTTADLLKNYLYGRAQNELDLVKKYWTTALGALELSAADKKFVAFLRYYWGSRVGHTREKDLYSSIQKNVRTQADAVDFARSLADGATKYASLDNPGHALWRRNGTSGRADIELLARFDLAPNYPLLLAALDNFTQSEFVRLVTTLVSWSVRASVTETINNGPIESKYTSAAVKVRAGEIRTVGELSAHVIDAIPTDSAFFDAFSIVQLRRNRNWMARYYLQALEREKEGLAEPAMVPNPDENQLNLEHVLPQNAKPGEWTEIATKADSGEWAYRFGNMVLLSKTENNAIGNGNFRTKKVVLTKSALRLTAEVGRKRDWTPSHIESRQKELAALAVKTWPR